MVESAISRSETTGFLSLSRSTVSCEPDEIIRARCAASKTRSNRLSTLLMQSSTVTRAIDCRSVKWGPICWLLGLVIAAEDVSQGKICDLPSRKALLTPPGARRPERPDTARLPSRTSKSHHCIVKSLGFLPSPHHNCGGDCGGKDSPNFRMHDWKMRASFDAVPKT